MDEKRPLRAWIVRFGAAAALAGAATALADSPWLYGIHWYGNAGSSQVETMTGGKGIWSLEIVQTNSDVWWGAAWQRDNRFNAMAARGHSLIVRIERNWGETVPYPGNLPGYLPAVQQAAQDLANVCHIWQIGNEMNINAEWGGNVLTAAQYVDAYRQIRAAIRAVSSPLGPQIVLVGPVSPGGAVGGVRHTDGNQYLAQMCDLLGPAEVDGFALHGYAAPWNDAVTSRKEFQAGYLTQLAILQTKGYSDAPAFITEWNRRVEPINDANEAASAQFLSGAFADLHAWNQQPGSHPISAACWFIYQNDAGWANYSIEYLHGVGPGGANNDLFDAFAFACGQNYATSWPTPTTPKFSIGLPSGMNAARHATATADAGDGALAIDGVVSVASKWTAGPGVPPHWLALDLGGVRSLTGFVVRHAGAAGELSAFNTQAFSLEVADSPGGPWEVEDLIYNGLAESVTARTYITPRAKQFVRLVVVDAGIDNYARIPEFEVYAMVPPGDFNQNGAVDAADFASMLFCLRGPDLQFDSSATCVRGDFDTDRDVDLRDAAGFQAAFER